MTAPTRRTTAKECRASSVGSIPQGMNVEAAERRARWEGAAPYRAVAADRRAPLRCRGLVRQGTLLVVRYGAIFPPLCLACGAEDDLCPCEQTFRWIPPEAERLGT